jgi:hypothetical protein
VTDRELSALELRTASDYDCAFEHFRARNARISLSWN